MVTDTIDPNQFLGLPCAAPENVDAVIVPIPLEKTVSYGTGTSRGPRAILDASCQIETFDEETLVDFAERPKLHTLPLVLCEGELPECFEPIRAAVAPRKERFVLGLGGEHSVTYGILDGLREELDGLWIVHIDAHADLIDRLDGRRWSHGTVMRRLHERGCRLIQIGIRSLSREEYDYIAGQPTIETFFAHQLPERWAELGARLDALAGDVYLSIDLDGLDPAVIPSTGTPQPDGLSWRQMIEVIRRVTSNRACRLIGADVVELIASPHPPGCDLAAAKVAAKVLAFWWRGLRGDSTG